MAGREAEDPVDRAVGAEEAHACRDFAAGVRDILYVHPYRREGLVFGECGRDEPCLNLLG